MANEVLSVLDPGGTLRAAFDDPDQAYRVEIVGGSGGSGGGAFKIVVNPDGSINTISVIQNQLVKVPFDDVKITYNSSNLLIQAKYYNMSVLVATVDVTYDSNENLIEAMVT